MTSYVPKVLASLTMAFATGSPIDSSLPSATPTIQYVSTPGSRGQLASPIFGDYRAVDSIGISASAEAAIGWSGVTRLTGFRRLAPGWDGGDSRTLDVHSLKRLSEFFSRFQLQSRDIAIFMSHAGNVVINWHDLRGGLVEIEFFPSRMEYFVETSNLDDSTSLEEDGMSRVYDIVKEYLSV